METHRNPYRMPDDKTRLLELAIEENWSLKEKNKKLEEEIARYAADDATRFIRRGQVNDLFAKGTILIIISTSMLFVASMIALGWSVANGKDISTQITGVCEWIVKFCVMFGACGFGVGVFFFMIAMFIEEFCCKRG